MDKGGCHDIVDVVFYSNLVNCWGHHVSVGEYVARIVDKKASTVKHTRLSSDIGKIACEINKLALFVETREVEMLAASQSEVVIILVTDKHHARFLFVEDIQWVFLAASKNKYKECD